MRVLIAADTFKDALPAREVCEALARGIQSAHSGVAIRCCPMADGGEGTAEVLAEALQLEWVTVPACDPLGRPQKATYGLSGNGSVAFIEMARTAGLALLLPHERNPLQTHTIGVGLQIVDALKRGATEIIIAIGGSATNDAGMGMATALGWQFLDSYGQPIKPIGANLGKAGTIVPPYQPLKAAVRVICDVTNPLFGLEGAAYMYALQKGASPADLAYLDAGLRHFAAIVQQHGLKADPYAPGSGAAGGLGFGASAFFNAELSVGAEVVMDLIGFDQQLQWADVVLTGEGQLDAQTAYGKLIHRLCQRAARYQKPVFAFCGNVQADAHTLCAIGLKNAFDINTHWAAPRSLQACLERTAQHLERAAFEAFPTIATQS